MLIIDKKSNKNNIFKAFFRKAEEHTKNMERLKIEINPVGISSTDIRKRLNDGFEIKNLVPERVEEYIKERGLYLPS